MDTAQKSHKDFLIYCSCNISAEALKYYLKRENPQTSIVITNEIEELNKLIESDAFSVLLLNCSFALTQNLEDTIPNIDYRKIYTILVSDRLSNKVFFNLSNLGIKAFLYYNADLSSLNSAIQSSLTGEPFFCKQFHTFKSTSNQEQTIDVKKLELLSPREKEVIKLLGNRLDPMEVAESLNINVKTVFTYKARVKEKFLLKNDADFYFFLFENSKNL